MSKVQDIIDIQMPDEHVVNFEQFLGLLLKWNRAYNLTAITDPLEVYEKHFADSLFPTKFIEKNSKLVDIGTGAGFPGIPIKILRSDVDVTLVEATAKKVSFCEHVIRELELKKIRVVSARAELPETAKKLGQFDVVITRATLKLPNFIKCGSKYVNDGGKLIAMLGSAWADELDSALPQVKKAGLKLVNVEEYTLQMSQAKRALLIFQKK